jgi:hypothetical protein
VTNLQNAWRNCASLTSFPFIDLSSCTNVSSAWRDCPALDNFAQVDLSKVSAFNFTWSNCGYIENFPVIDMRSIEFGTNCFSNASIPTQSYTNIIKKLWDNRSVLNTGVTVNFGTSTIGTSAQNQYNYLISNTNGKSWTIADGGFISGASASLMSSYLYNTYYYCDQEAVDVMVHDGGSIFNYFSLVRGQSLKSQLPFIQIFEPGELSLFLKMDN